MLDTRTFQSITEDLIPMNDFLGLKLEHFDMETGDVTTRLDMRPEYLIDAAAGASAASLDDCSLLERVATTNMRVDYLKPAQGEALLTSSSVMRPGNRIVNVRSELRGERAHLAALGSNTFNMARRNYR